MRNTLSSIYIKDNIIIMTVFTNSFYISNITNNISNMS